MNKLLLSIFLVVSLLIPGNLSCFAVEDNQLVAENSTPKKTFNPKPASASVYNLGLKSYEQGDLESAVTFFKKAVELDPEFIDAHFNLGAIYKKQKNFHMAINSLQKAVEINPEDYEAVFELGNCYLEDKDYLKAKKYFAAIPQDFSKYTDARQNMEKADKYIAIEATSSSPEDHAKVLQSPDVQAQILADTLEKELEKDISSQASSSEKIQTTDQTTQNNKAQLLVNTLTKPSKDSIKESIRIVSKNFHGPTGVAKDSQNNVYIANFTKDAIEKITPDGKREIFLEKKGLQGPVGLAIDENDNLYVANYSGATIVKITPSKEVSVLVSNIERPYYLFYDDRTSKLFSTVQGNDSLVEIDTHNLSKLPITFK